MISTHNTMTYLRPKEWYLRCIKFISRCQRVNYIIQHEKYGVRGYDIRLFWDKYGELEYRHGLISYDACNFTDFLEFCNEHHLIVRVLFEERNFSFLKKRSLKMNLKEKFRETCKLLETEFPNIKFYGGRNSHTGEMVYDFGNDVKEIGFYSSETSLFPFKDKFTRILDDWCPEIYARLKNKKNMLINKVINEDDNIVVHYDFVDIQ